MEGTDEITAQRQKMPRIDHWNTFQFRILLTSNNLVGKVCSNL